MTVCMQQGNHTVCLKDQHVDTDTVFGGGGSLFMLIIRNTET